MYNKKILVFGLGLNEGGVGAAKFFAQKGAKVKVTDLKNKEILKPSLDQLKKFNISYTLEEHKFEDIDWADLIIKNPAVSLTNRYMEYALKHGKQIETDLGIFLQYVKPGQIIGITGTKGKSTTASLIYSVLQQPQPRRLEAPNPVGWNDIVLAGNIGKSVLEVIPFITEHTLVVLEISSFQLETFEKYQVSPKWAVITNITPDHLNYYQNIDEYTQAKRVIAKYQTKDDFLFIRKNDPLVDQDNFLSGLKGQIIYFSASNLPKSFNPALKGQHNLENIAAAYHVGKIFNIDSSLLLKTLTAFKGIPFRMELIQEWNGVKIYNDTAATSPESSIKAIKTLGANLHPPPGCLVLICGGMNKKMDYTEYVETIAKYAKYVFFLEGDSTAEIIKKVQSSKFKVQNKGIYNSIEKILSDIKKLVEQNDIILFSPAATSFNLFQNEFDRGRKFNEAVKKIFT